MDRDEILEMISRNTISSRMEEGTDLIHEIYVNDFVDELLIAISVTRCSLQLLCVDKGDDNAITKGYEYKSINQDDTHYKIVDNYGDENYFLKKYFKIVD